MVPSTIRGRSAAIGLALLLPLASVPVTAAAAGDAVPLSLLMGDPDMSPSKAAALRIAPQTQARGIVDGGDPVNGGVTLDRAASEFGDPVLYLDAGDAYLVGAETDRDTLLCDAAAERAAIAMDILYFHIDSAADENFKLVETSEVPALIVRAQDMIAAAAKLKEEIQNDSVAPVAAAEPDKKRKKQKGDGKWLKIGGIGVASLGGALTVLGVVGLGIGAVNQSRAEDPSVYGTAYDDVEGKGKRGNLIAGLGFGFGGAALIGGVTMYLVGRSRAKKAGGGGDKPKKAKDDEPLVRVAPTLNGMAVSGRF